MRSRRPAGYPVGGCRLYSWSAVVDARHGLYCSGVTLRLAPLVISPVVTTLALHGMGCYAKVVISPEIRHRDKG